MFEPAPDPDPAPDPAARSPAFGVPVDSPRRPAVDPADQWPPVAQAQPGRPWSRGGRARVLLAAGALALLLVGFLLGAAVAGGRAEPAAAATATTVQPPVPAPALPEPGAPAAGGPVPQQCVAAIERADQAISYLVGNIRDRRLSQSLLAFVATKNACLEQAER